MRIAIGADHEGYELKDKIALALRNDGHVINDFGTFGPEPVDYPIYAKAVGESIRKGESERGILICGSGVGVAVAINKMRGIRAGLCHDVFSAHQSVEHDNVNVLCLGPCVIGPLLAMDLVNTWIKSRFTGEERHVRRLKEIEEMEDEG